MTSRSGRGRWQRVLDARQQARTALGLDAGEGDLFEVAPKMKRADSAAAPVPLPIMMAIGPRGFGVLTLDEAAHPLGGCCSQLGGMIDAARSRRCQRTFFA